MDLDRGASIGCNTSLGRGVVACGAEPTTPTRMPSRLAVEPIQNQNR
jgi:hypothetical protein